MRETRSVCRGCPEATATLNGMYCRELGRYVEYADMHPCGHDPGTENRNINETDENSIQGNCPFRSGRLSNGGHVLHAAR